MKQQTTTHHNNTDNEIGGSEGLCYTEKESKPLLETTVGLRSEIGG